MVCCPKDSKSKQVPLHVTISRFGNLHILFGLFLIALGICQILFAVQDDIHIAFRVTPIWVGTLIGVTGFFLTLFIAKNPSTFRMKFLPFCCMTSLITSLSVLAITILSLNNLSHINGVNKEEIKSDEDPLHVSDVTKRMIIDWCLVGVSIITSQLPTYLFASSNSNHGNKNPSNDVTAVAPSSVRFGDDVTVEDYFNRKSVLRHQKTVYDDFPDFDNFRNNLEHC